MTWIVKTRKPDGTTHSILCDRPDQTLENIKDQRGKGFEVWVEDETGKKVDEKTFRPPPVYTAALYEGLDGDGPLIAGPENVRAKNDEEAARSALSWAAYQFGERPTQVASVRIMRDGMQFDQRMIKARP